MSVKFRVFEASGVLKDEPAKVNEASLKAAQFATEVGRERLINISQSLRGTAQTTVWFWDDDDVPK